MRLVQLSLLGGSGRLDIVEAKFFVERERERERERKSEKKLLVYVVIIYIYYVTPVTNILYHVYKTTTLKLHHYIEVTSLVLCLQTFVLSPVNYKLFIVY